MTNSKAISAKIKGMYGKRIKRQDYDLLIAMQGFSPIAHFLHEHPGYGEVLAAVDVPDIGRVQLEPAIRQSLIRDYNKLFPFVFYEDKEMMNLLVRHVEMLEILSFLRRLRAGHFDRTPLLFAPEFQHKLRIDLPAMLLARTEEQLLVAAQNSVFYPILQHFLVDHAEKFSFTDLELALQSFYYTTLYKSIDNHYKNRLGKDLKEAFGRRLDLSNITRILRLRTRFTQNPDEVYGYIIPVSYRVKPDFLRNLLTAADDNAVNQLLLTTPYKELHNLPDYTQVERLADSALYQFYKSVLQNKSPSILHVLAYIRLKELEIKNIINIVECIKYNIPQNEIYNYLVGVN